MDDKTKTGKGDDSRINVSESYEVQYWSEKLKVSQAGLREAVKQAGPLVAQVRDYLNKNK